MGEVWRATDTQLNRDVALKILPEAFASDPDRLARFQREAQVLASLNHPNIAQIHGIEEDEGTRALVLELVEGPPLADRISKGPIPIDEALPIAKQIAEALEAAHEAGIIHRDLKPANIKVREDGTVKVLDFGLAKALDPNPQGDPSESPTLTAAGTRAGVILGTAAYMSPEQAKGQRVDRRTDVWAFGCVLHEMLSGARAFNGDNVSDTVASVLRSEPDWDALPDDTPPRVSTLLRRCLEKEPRGRVQAIGDVRLALEGGFETTISAAHDSAVAPRLRTWQRPVPLVVAGLTLLVLGSLATWAWLSGGSSPGPVPPIRFAIALPGSDDMDIEGTNLFTLSPDGQTLVYVARRDGVQQLYRSPINEFAATPMMDTRDAQYPFFSPDGQSVGFFAGAELRMVALAGGPSRAVTAVAPGHRGAYWGDDGTIVFGQSDLGLWRIPASGLEATFVTASDDGRPVWYPQVLPERGAILFTVSEIRPDAGDLHVLDPDTGAHRLVVRDAVAGRVLPTGHLIFQRSRALWAVPFDEDRLEVQGNPVAVVEGVNVGANGSVKFAVADDGTLVYQPNIGRSNRRLAWLDRNGGRTLLDAEPRPFISVRLSHDGEALALVVITEDNFDVWIYDLVRDVSRRLTSGPYLDRFPVWTPDDRRPFTISRPSLYTPHTCLHIEILTPLSAAGLLSPEGRKVRASKASDPSFDQGTKSSTSVSPMLARLHLRIGLVCLSY